ncbi:iron complex transport system substrate-binding protein [Cohnella sp. SGD-V74]|uniref:siderophore ABC transporter substrate-binding protein n=1 Tax=unclassified Cohnella TaxID=2636738 RepID=UPI000D44095A|nr:MULTISPECIES: siderophore ABC transporter substrate-binding protein [unclassified Cohnella]PRX72738.1 iron complex transport system substrate-binding protein [Cohnella sp. SGD-V74]
MKKAFSLILMSVMAIAILAACGSKNNNEGAASPSASPAASPSASASASESASPSESAAPAEVTITHALGTAVVKTNPEKVVVFDYGTLDTLGKLGIEVLALPKASIPGNLSQYDDAKYEDAGTLFEPDFEKLNKLKPDVIFIGGRTGEAYEELNKIAPTIQMSVDFSNYLDSFKNNANIIGQIFGKEAEVSAAIAEYDAAVADLQGKASGAGKALIVLTTGGKISAYGPGSRFGSIHDIFGFAPVDADIKVDTHGNSISNEYIAEKNPDVLFVVDRDAVVSGDGASPAKEVIENDLVKKTNAYKNGKIVYLNPNFWYLSGGGLNTELEMVKEAAQAVQ